MNLFISIVSSAFEDVQSMSTIISYKQRIYFVYSSTMIQDLFESLGGTVSHAKIFTLATEVTETDLTSKTMGIVKPI